MEEMTLLKNLSPFVRSFDDLFWCLNAISCVLICMFLLMKEGPGFPLFDHIKWAHPYI
jgi:hypothetical protein